MRGREEKQIEAFSYIPLEDRIPAKHPLRPFKIMVNEILHDMNKDLDALYAESGFVVGHIRPREACVCRRLRLHNKRARTSRRSCRPSAGDDS